MVVCTPCMGMGVRHLQYILYAALITLEFWIQEITTKSFLHAVSDTTSSTRKTKLTPIQLLRVQQIMYTCFAMGRFTSGFATLKLNNKYLLVSLIVIESIISTACYLLAFELGFHPIAILCGVLGYTRSFHWTLVMNMLANWMPPTENTTAISIIVITREVLALSIRFFSDSADLEMLRRVLFVVLTLHALWAVLYVVLGAEGPDKSFVLSKVEHAHLVKHIGPRKKRRCSAKAPWKSIFRSTILYGWLIADFGRECSVTLLAEGFLMCLKNVPLAPVAGIQVATGFCFAAIMGASLLSDRLIVKDVLTPGQVRKIYSSVGCCGASISMILSAYSVKPSPRFAFLIVGHVFSAVMAIGQPVALFDISPNYAALMFSIFTFMRCLMFALKVFLDSLTGVFPLTDYTYEILFYRYGFLVFITNLLFLLCGDIEKKPFDAYDTSDWTKESIISYP